MAEANEALLGRTTSLWINGDLIDSQLVYLLLLHHCMVVKRRHSKVWCCLPTSSWHVSRGNPLLQNLRCTPLRQVAHLTVQAVLENASLSKEEIELAQNLGKRLARIASSLRESLNDVYARNILSSQTKLFRYLALAVICCFYFWVVRAWRMALSPHRILAMSHLRLLRLYRCYCHYRAF